MYNNKIYWGWLVRLRVWSYKGFIIGRLYIIQRLFAYYEYYSPKASVFLLLLFRSDFILVRNFMCFYNFDMYRYFRVFKETFLGVTHLNIAKIWCDMHTFLYCFLR